ncbi:MAG: hypothetical protein JNK58_02155 [Phycisphaerae bacterium]|nr:hypothetical protein [Phycisphaerae bacterium]
MFNRRHILLAFLLSLLTVTGGVRAGETWRAVGTFNDWNPGDDSWRLTPQQEGSSRLVIERPFSAGDYEFRLIRQDDDARESFGRGAKADSLDERGENLTLFVPGDGVFRLILNAPERTWTFLCVKAERTVFDARLFGPLIEGRSILIDFSRTLTVDRWDRGMISFEAPSERLGAQRALDRYGRRVQIVLNGRGPLPLTIRLSDAGQVIEKKLDLNIEAEALFRYATAEDRHNTRTVALQPVSPGVRRAVVAFARDTELFAAEVSAGEGETVGTQNVRVPAGTYAVELRDGSVVTQRDPSLPLMLIPGNWRSFAFTPSEPAETVHLVGDFNRWARPGRPGAVELAARADGSFFTIINPPAGEQRYRFLINHSIEAIDPAARSAAIGPGGSPASVMQVGPSAKEFPDAKPNSIDRAAVRHDPGSGLDFVPISRALGLADIGLSTLPGDVTGVVMTVETAAASGRERVQVPLTRGTNAGGFDRWSARVMTGEPQALYSFTLTDGTDSYTTPPYSASIEPDTDRPAWALGSVWYEVPVSRFRNGNALNDPAAPDSPGGDLQGLAQAFGELRDLGVGTLCLSPIFESPSWHKRDTRDHRHIDPSLAAPNASAAEAIDGTGDPKTWGWSAADRSFIDEFLPAARAAGLRVVLDADFGQTTADNFAFRDVALHGRESPYAGWFSLVFGEDGRLASWGAADQNPALPRFRREPRGGLAPPTREFVFAVTRRWMDPNGDGNPSDGIDGWRVLSPRNLSGEFWREWRALVRSINPEAVVVADLRDPGPFRVEDDCFDGHTNAPFASAVTDWVGRRPGMTARALEAALLPVFNDAAGAILASPNMLESVSDGKEPTPAARRSVLMGLALRCLYAGAPTIAAGEEIGAWGGGNPGVPTLIKWNGRADADARAEHARWLRLRTQPSLAPVLRYGATRSIDSGDSNVFAFERSLNGLRVVGAVNRQDRPFPTAAFRGSAPGAPSTIEPWSSAWWIVTPK